MVLALLVRVEGKVPELFEFNLIQRNLRHLRLPTRRHKRIQIQSLRDFVLVSQELNLLQPHDISELENNVLRSRAVLLFG